jgi:fermentation-respiration switch protein FrsA (DUF1100 family)
LKAPTGKIRRFLFMPIKGIYLLLLVIVALLCLWRFYPHIENLFIFFPDARFEALPADLGLASEDCFFESEDGVLLHGWFFPLRGPAPTLLFCHGNAGNISHRLENVKRLLERQIQVFIFDYRGYGKSAGRPSEAGLYLDGLAAYDFLVDRKRIPPSRIVPFGRSLGAAVALEIGLQREVRALILESAFTSTKGMARAIPLFMPFSPLVPAHYDNLAKIGRISVPKLLIHGDADEIVPFSMGAKLYDAAPDPKRFFPIRGAGHNDTYLRGGRKYFETFSEFLGNASD